MDEEHRNLLSLFENVVYEFLCGDLSKEERDTFMGFVSQFPVLGFDREAAIKASDIYRGGKDRGSEVPHPDAMIAGIYAAHGIDEIVTGDPGHFREAEGVSPLSYR